MLIMFTYHVIFLCPVAKFLTQIFPTLVRICWLVIFYRTYDYHRFEPIDRAKDLFPSLQRINVIM